MNKKTIVTIIDMNKKFSRTGLVLNNINIEINSGEKVAILGPSGSGKSTLLHIAAGLDCPSSGEHLIYNKNYRSFSPREINFWRNQGMGIIYQHYHLLPDFTVFENVAIPLLISGKSNTQNTRNKVNQILAELGLGDKSTSFMHQLSGGQRQRVAIARAMICNPDILFADEPTGNLDANQSSVIVDIFDSLSLKYSVSILLVTHDPGLIKDFDKIYYIDNKTLRLEK
jgi:ABC-type lipoprotein export system ATPase subunit